MNLAQKLAQVDEAFSPKIVGRYNENKLMVAKVRGEFVWHAHEETDDLFLVLAGRLTIELREQDRGARAGRALRRPARRGAPPTRRGGGPHPARSSRAGTLNTGDSTEREPAPEEEL